MMMMIPREILCNKAPVAPPPIPASTGVVPSSMLDMNSEPGKIEEKQNSTSPSLNLAEENYMGTVVEIRVEDLNVLVENKVNNLKTEEESTTKNTS